MCLTFRVFICCRNKTGVPQLHTAMSGNKVENWQLPVEMKVRGKNLLRDPENIPTDIAFKVGMEDGKTYRCHK